MKQLDFDVAIIGGSLAGATACIALKQLCPQLRIGLIEPNSFPRFKVCGSGLGAQGVEILKRLGIDIDTVVHTKLSGYELTFGNKLGARVNKRIRTGGSVGISRSVLDNLLYQSAKGLPGVTLLRTKLMKCQPFAEHCRLVMDDGQELRAGLVLLACGASSRFVIRPNRNAQRLRYAYSMEVKASALSKWVSIATNPGYETYLTPVGNNKYNLAVISERTKFKELYRVQKQHEILSEFARRTGGALEKVNDPVAVGPLGNFRNISPHPRMFLIGDAAEQFDPIGGMGMTHAVLSAKLASEHLSRFFLVHDSLDEVSRKYRIQRELRSRPLRGFTRLSYLSLVRLQGSNLSRIINSTPLAQEVSKAIHSTNPVYSLGKGILILAGL